MGSTFKPITAVMGFDKNLISPEMKFNIKNSIKGINDYTKYEGDGNYNTEKIIVHSSNIGAAKIASHIGKKNQIDFFKKVGFFDRLNFDIRICSFKMHMHSKYPNLELIISNRI